MSIVLPGDGRPGNAIDLPSLPVHLNDRPKSIPFESRQASVLLLNSELQDFIFQHSEIDALKYCSERNQCRRRFCPWCARRISKNTRYRLQPLAKEFREGIEWTSTTVSMTKFSEAWEAQRLVVARFLSNGWLTKRTTAWMRETEVTHSLAGWHIHTHWLLFLESDLRAELVPLVKAVPGRWIDSAGREGVGADLRGQYISRCVDVRGQVNYATKGLLTASRRSGHQTLANILADYQRGDANAAELWLDFAFHFGKNTRRNWRATGGSFRGRRGSDASPR